MNPSELIKKDDWGKVSETEQKMWRCRKNVYIVCSRASAFLYFITDLDKPANKNANELRRLIEQVSKSFRGKNESGQTCEFKVNKPKTQRKPDIFKDGGDDIFNPIYIDETSRIVEFDGILSVPALASAFRILQHEFQDLLPPEAKAKENIEITVHPDHANIVAKKLGIELKRVNSKNDIPKKQKEAKTNHVNTESHDNADTKRHVSSKLLQINKNIKQISKKRIIVDKGAKFRSTTLPFTGDCTNRKINKIILFDTTYYPATWQELLMKVSEKLYEKHKDSFQKCLTLQGTKWSIYIDIEGFSVTYEKNNQALISLGALMEGIYLIGSTYFCGSPNRIFAHQLGDGFIIVGEFGVKIFEVPLSIAILLMRLVLKAGGTAKAAISEGSFADIKGCYPNCIRENTDENGVIRLGSGLMTIFPVMGTALIIPHKVLSLSPSGSLLVIEKSLFSRIPKNARFTDIFDSDFLAIDWLHTSFPLMVEIVDQAGLLLPNTLNMESLLNKYLESNELPSSWKRNTRKALNLQ